MRKLGVFLVCAVSGWLTVASIGAQQPERVNVLVLFRSRPNGNDVGDVQRAGGRIKYNYATLPAMAVNMPSQAINGLSNNPNIEIIEPDAIATINRQDPSFAAELTNTWGVQKIGAGTAHELGFDGVAVVGGPIKVAVIDTGVNCGHIDLGVPCGGANAGYDFVNDDADPSDDHGHGTHVAGTIGGRRNGFGVVGVAPNVWIVPIKVLSASGSGYYSDIIAGIDYATLNGVKVTNNSYGGSLGSATMEAALRVAAANGVVTVAAAGNSGTQSGTGDNVGYPAKYTSTIAVAATDSIDARASFSSTGPRVEVAAPGVSIRSTVMSGGYAAWNGTSMATPHVAGLAALLYAKGVTNSNNNGLINDEIRNTIALSALDLSPGGRDSKTGFGRIRVMEALNYDAIPATSAVTAISYSSAPGKNKDLVITVTAVYKPVVPASGLTVTLLVTSNTGFARTVNGQTNADGVVTFTLAGAPSGTYSSVVQSATGGNLNFDGATPNNSFNKK